MEQIKRQRIYEGGNGTVDKWTINFNGGIPPNLQKTLVSAQIATAGSFLAVEVNTTNCTGIAGSMEVKQAMQDSGKPNYPYAAPATLAVAVSANVAVGMDGTALSFMGTHVVIDASGITAWPTEGIMTITVVTKH